MLTTLSSWRVAVIAMVLSAGLGSAVTYKVVTQVQTTAVCVAPSPAHTALRSLPAAPVPMTGYKSY